MPINSCKKCNRLFESHIESKLCPKCKQLSDRQFLEVKKFIRVHKSAGLHQISEECNVAVKQILQWVREERLFFDESSDVALPCMACGTLIRSGEYCVDCRKKLHKSLSGMYVGKPDNKPVKETAPVAFHSKRNLH